MRPDATQVAGRVILGKSVVTVEDVLDDPDYDQPLATAGRWRRMLGVPMLREGKMLGVIGVGWQQPGPISQVHEEPAQDLRRPGRDRDRERAAVQRDAERARPPDGDRGHPARDQPLAHRRPAGVRRDRRGRAPFAAVDVHRAAAPRRRRLSTGATAHRDEAQRRDGWKIIRRWCPSTLPGTSRRESSSARRCCTFPIGRRSSCRRTSAPYSRARASTRR